MKIVVCGGGTVGHIAPILAVIDALYAFDRKIEVLYIGGGTEQEKSLLQKYPVKYATISAGKFRRYGRGLKAELFDVRTISKNIVDAGRFSKGLLQARKILKNFRPDVVFTKGGYVTVPVGLAASRLRVPLVIHESDAEFGLATRMLAKRAKHIATGVPLKFLPEGEYSHKCIFTGNPVRSELVGVDSKLAHKKLNLSVEKPVVFLFGGSQGARDLNSLIFEGLDRFTANFQLVHHTGAQGIEQARFARHKLSAAGQANYRPYEFLSGEKMGQALAAADIIIARASMGSITEIAANAKPSFLIPSPYSTNFHQQRNAEVLAKAGAARILDQNELTPARLCSEVDKLLIDTSAKSYLAKTIHGFYQKNAAQNIAKLLIQTGGTQV